MLLSTYQQLTPVGMRQTHMRMTSCWMTFAAAPSKSLLTTLVHYTQLEMPDVFGLFVVTEKFIAPNTNSPVLPLRGRDSSVCIATRYGLDGPGIESRWGARFSAPVQTCPGAHPASCIMGTGPFPGVKRPGRGADLSPTCSAEVEGRVPLLTLRASVAC